MTKARDISGLIGAGGIIDNSKITLDANEIPSLDTAKITTGTFADARIAPSNVSQHATSFDDSKIQQDLMVLALQQATDANKSAYSLSNSFIEQFEDSTGIDVQTNTGRNTSEYVSSNAVNLEVGGTNTAGGLFGSGGNTQAGWSGYNNTIFTFSANSNTSVTYNVSSGNHTYWGSRTLTGNYTFKFKTTATNTTASATNTGMQIGVAINNSTSNSSGGNSIYNDNDSDNFYMGWNGVANQTLYFYRGQTTQASVSANVTANYVFQFVRDNAGTLKVYGGEFTNPYTDGGTLLHTFTGYSNTGDDTPIVAIGYPNNQTTSNGTVIASEFYINNNITTLGGGSTFSSSGNFTSVSQTAPATVSKMGIVVLYKNLSGTATLNTDLIAQVSANNGTNYATVTLTPRGTFSTGINIAVANNVTVTSGTSCKYKISFANQSSGVKETQVHGIGLLY
jgi:hypothetical protein